VRHALPLAFHSPGHVCPREGTQALLVDAWRVVSRAGAVPQAWQLTSSAQASSSPHSFSSRGDFPGGRAQGTGPGTCCGSHAQLQAKTAAGGGRLREEEERDLLGMPPRAQPPHSQPAPSPATRQRVRGAGPLVTQPSHAACQPLLTTRYCLATTRTKCRSEEQSFPLARLQCRGLSSLSVFPRGSGSLESLSCQPHAVLRTCLQILPLQPCTLEPDPSLLRCRIACDFSAGVYLHSSSPDQPEVWGKMCPRRPWGMKITEARSTPFLAGLRGCSTSRSREQWLRCRCLPRCLAGAPPRSSTCRGCGYAGDTRTRNPTRRFSFKKRRLLLCSF